MCHRLGDDPARDEPLDERALGRAQKLGITRQLRANSAPDTACFCAYSSSSSCTRRSVRHTRGAVASHG